MLEVVKQHGWPDTRTEPCDKGQNGTRTGISGAISNDAQNTCGKNRGSRLRVHNARNFRQGREWEGFESGVSTSDDSERVMVPSMIAGVTFLARRVGLNVVWSCDFWIGDRAIR
jgi:hypothetical protein